jgi:hypothetical protein
VRRDDFSLLTSMSVVRKKLERISFSVEMWEMFPLKKIIMLLTKTRCLREKEMLIFIPLNLDVETSLCMILLRHYSNNKKRREERGHP